MDTELISKAYKKFKSFVYYDKNAYYLKKEIAEFESELGMDLDKYLANFTEILNGRKYEVKGTEPPIVLPKKVENDESEIMFNSSNNYQVTKIQYFAKPSIEDAIISTLWVMTVGYMMDKTFSDELYGNRVHIKPAASWSPHLFRPYPMQYSSWRDNGLSAALKCNDDGLSCTFINTDFSSFYYSLSVNDDLKEEIKEKYCTGNEEEKGDSCYLTDLVFQFIYSYSNCFKSKKVLPVGYPPSNVLSNYLMKDFDNMIHDKVLPMYYGRYVDDIILVVRCSPDEVKTEKDKMNYLYTILNGKGIGIKKTEDNALEIELDIKHDIKLIVNKDKTNCEVIDHNYSAAQINLLKRNINDNSSEFRYMPTEDITSVDIDYLSVFEEEYSLNNKPGEMKELNVSRYKLSKYLGKNQILISLINDKDRAKKFHRILMKNFTDHAILDNWPLWERMLQIVLFGKEYDKYIDFIARLNTIIDNIQVKKDADKYDVFQDCVLNEIIQANLRDYITVTVARTLSTIWGPKIGNMINEHHLHDAANLRRKMCVSRMVDNHCFLLPIDGFIMDNEIKLDDSKDVDMLSLSSTVAAENSLDLNTLPDYIYRPYLFKMHELGYCNMIATIQNKQSYSQRELLELFIRINYGKSDGNLSLYPLSSGNIEKKLNYINVGNSNIKTIRVGVSNTPYPEYDAISNTILEEEGRTSQKLHSTNRIFNQAIKEDTDVLVMPELYLPPEWLPYCIRTCVKNDMMLISGLGYIKVGNRISNITVTAMPFKDEYGHSDAVLAYHLKKYYSPAEEDEFGKNDCECNAGENNSLYIWNGFKFTTFCCYEMASICDRAMFKSRVHALFAVECNKDINYYDSIVISTSRDLHCFVIQVNKSSYGDSRITAPMKTEKRDIVKIKGGENSTVIVGSLDIDGLIKHRKDELIDDIFKGKPPGFNLKQSEETFDESSRSNRYVLNQ